MPRRLLLIARLLRSLSLVGVGLGAFAAASPAAVHPAAVHPAAADPATVDPAAAPRCPARDPLPIPANAWGPAKLSLAPRGADSIRLCRYAGLNAPRPLSLARSSLHVTPSFVVRVVGEIDRLPPPPAGPVACPAGDDSEIVAELGYAGGQSVAIGFDLTECDGVSNGDVSASAFGFGSPREFGPQLLAELERITGYHRSAI